MALRTRTVIHTLTLGLKELILSSIWKLIRGEAVACSPGHKNKFEHAPFPSCSDERLVTLSAL